MINTIKYDNTSIKYHSNLNIVFCLYFITPSPQPNKIPLEKPNTYNNAA